MKTSKHFLATILFCTSTFLFICTSASAQYTKLIDLTSVNGSRPLADLINDGTFLYGTTCTGGPVDSGVVFKIKPNGTGDTVLHNFTGGVNGSYPCGSLISDGTFLYGMTYLGGTNYMGTIFKVKPDGTGYTDLLDFAGATNGSNPYGSLMFDGTYLYGMTKYGGINSSGVIFKIMTNGSGYVKLLDFNGANGVNPSGNLYSDGVYLYGMTSYGGVNNMGLLFKIKKDGTGYTDILDFAGTTNGSDPLGSLISDGTFLYGMTHSGGTNNLGKIFKIKPDGTGYANLLNFAGLTNGQYPYGSLVSDGTSLYGMTYQGGLNNMGVLFKIKYDGTGYLDLLDFDGTNGSYPFSSLISDGAYLYGMTDQGGASNWGAVFKYLPPLSIANTTSTNVSCYGGANGTATVSVSGGLPPYTYSWSSSPIQSTSTATGLVAGTYTCTITDANSVTSTANVTITQPITALSSTPFSTNASCNNNDGSAGITVSGGTSPYNYLWSNSYTTSTISGIGVGSYSVTTTDNNGCTVVNSFVINSSIAPLTPSICMVTVDSFGINNEIYWDKTQYAASDSFIIYRYDAFSSSYLQIGAVSGNALSMFTDTARNIGGPNGGDPQYSNFRYKLAVRDACGNTSAMSPYHQSIFMQQAAQNFSWNAYAIEGVSAPVSGYQFMRNDSGTGIWNVLIFTAGIAATDPNYASYPNGGWRVQALGLTCTPTRASINTTRSNIKQQGISIGINANDKTESISMYPNPANESVTIELDQQTGTTTLKIFNTMGQLMQDEMVLPPSSGKTKKQIDLHNYSKGIYMVCIESNGIKKYKKLVVN